MQANNYRFGSMVADILRHGLENPWCYDKLCHFYQSHEKCIGMMLEWYAIKHDKSQIESLADLAVHSDSDALSDIPYVLALFAQREWQGYMIDTYR